MNTKLSKLKHERLNKNKDKIERERLEQEKEAERIAKAKVKKKNTIIGVIVGIAVCVMIGFIIDASVIASRVTYESESAMESALQGTYIYRFTSSNRPAWGIVIENKKFRQHYYSDDEGRERDISFYPSRGYITVGSDTYIVKKDGNKTYLLNGSHEYRSGSLSSLDRDPDSESYKKDLSAAWMEAYKYKTMLETKQSSISSVSINGDGTCSGSYYYFDCTVRHTEGTIRWGKIKVSKDSSGKFEAQGLDYD